MRTLSITPVKAPVPDCAVRPEDLLAQLMEKKFVGIDSAPELESSAGWCHPEDYMLDPEDRALCIGPYVVWGLRRDARKVPAATKDKLTRKRILDWQEKESGRAGEQGSLEGTGVEPRKLNPHPKVPRDVRSRLKKEALEELLRRAVPEPRHVLLVWDRKAGLLFLHTTSASLVKAASDLWEPTFGAAAFIPLTPGRRIEAAGYEMPEKVVGAEFLTWLWRRAQTNRYEYQLRDAITGDYHDVKVEIEGHMALESGQGKDVAKVSLAGNLDSMEEAEKAIAAGRLIVRARLSMRNAGGEAWSFTLDAVNMAITGLSLPPVPDDLEDTDEEPLARETHRLMLLDKCVNYLGSLFEAWMEEQAKRGALRRADAPEGPTLAKGKKKAPAKDVAEVA